MCADAAHTVYTFIPKRKQNMKTYIPAILALLLGVVLTPTVFAEENAPAVEVVNLSALNAYAEDPETNVRQLSEFVRDNFTIIRAQMEDSPEQARATIEAVRTELDRIAPKDDPKGANPVGAMLRSLNQLEVQLDAKAFTLDSIKAEIAKSPKDLRTAEIYVQKLREFFATPEFRSDIAGNEAFITSEKQFAMDAVKGAGESAAAKIYERAQGQFVSYDRHIARLKQYRAMAGKEMMPFKADAWVGGPSLTEEDLKGKVLLLDFWAVWCGPCMWSVPNLVELQDKYGDKGLQVIGITRYYNYHWPEGADHAEKADEEISPEVEQQMMAKLCEEKKTNYPTAMIKEGADELYEFNLVSGIPHFVLIDQQGKIHSIDIGARDEVFQKFEQQIQQLLEKPAAN